MVLIMLSFGSKIAMFLLVYLIAFLVQIFYPKLISVHAATTVNDRPYVPKSKIWIKAQTVKTWFTNQVEHIETNIDGLKKQGEMKQVYPEP